MTLSAVFLLVRDLARSRAFYEAVLGAVPEKATASEARFALPGGAALTLHADLPDEARARWGIPREEGPRGWGVFLTFRTADVDGAARAAAARGGTLVRAPQEAPWGGRLAIAGDPDGYWIELTDRP